MSASVTTSQPQTSSTIQPNSQHYAINLTREDKAIYGDDYRSHLLDQYKMYVEMADRISARRMLSNSFFLTIHTTFLGAFALLGKDGQLFRWATAPVAAAMVLCVVWWLTIRSYKQLNSGKFKVINELEKFLPVAPFEEEWRVLDKGKSFWKYFTLTKVEHFVPVIFGLLYIVLTISKWIGVSFITLYA